MYVYLRPKKYVLALNFIIDVCNALLECKYFQLIFSVSSCACILKVNWIRSETEVAFTLANLFDNINTQYLLPNWDGELPELRHEKGMGNPKTETGMFHSVRCTPSFHKSLVLIHKFPVLHRFYSEGYLWYPRGL